MPERGSLSHVDVWECTVLGPELAVPVTLRLQVHLQGLGAQTAVVLALHTILSLGIRWNSMTFADMVQVNLSLLPALHVPWLSEP